MLLVGWSLWLIKTICKYLKVVFEQAQGMQSIQPPNESQCLQLQLELMPHYFGLCKEIGEQI